MHRWRFDNAVDDFGVRGLMMITKELLENFWVVKSDDVKKFNAMKRELKNYQKFITDQIGWRLIANDEIIKIEKTPAKAKSFMGIHEFTEVDDYLILLASLIYLEDKQTHEQFLFSQYVEAITMILEPYGELDWTKYAKRRSLVRVMEYCVAKRLYKITDGSLDAIKQDITNEVLYENTGLSKYFTVNLNGEAKDYNSLEDFERLDEGLEYDIGRNRVNRVYKELVTSPGVTWDNIHDADAKYIKNQRFNIQRNLDKYLGGQLQVYKNSAYLMVNHEDRFGTTHPGGKTISALVLFVSKKVVDLYHQGELTLQNNDVIITDRDNFKAIITAAYQQHYSGLSSEYRNMDLKIVIDKVLEYLIEWGMVKIERELVLIQAAMALTGGVFPKDYKEYEDEK